MLFALLLAGVLSAAFGTAAAALNRTPPASQEQATDEKDKDKKQQRQRQRRRVTATLVPTTPPAEGEEPAGEEEAADAAAAEAESDPADEATSEPGEAAPPAESSTASEAPPEAAKASAATEARGGADIPQVAPAAPSPPQPPVTTPGAELSERIDVVEVLLDVLVTDSSGNVVRDLGPEDFVVEEGGEIVPITALTFYGDSKELRGSGLAGERRSDRYFILFFHDQARNAAILRRAQMEAGRRARQWVDEELEPNDQVAVLGYDVRLKVYADFTRNAEEILQAIDLAATGRNEPKRDRREVQEPLLQADSPSLLINLPTGRDLRDRTKRFQETLTLLGHAAEGIVGRKNLLLFSIGFNDGNVVRPMWAPDPRFYPDMEQSLNNANIAVYTIDLSAAGRPGASPPGLSSSLSALATDTGGVFYDTFGNFLTPLRLVARDNRGYYLLSYTSRYLRGESGYREVKVRLKQGGHDVRYRRGYRYGEAPAPSD
jgi:VWFA-related protein